ncbi:MAG TPA: SMP-30/gluconolactonase/LRE family protein, partial [Roseiarcus sp.]|nr:SMP-30/gluconolactonase/LRE family protein [Roseiarcus sp.]
YAPDGRIDRIVALPCSQITCCAFGGKDLATLFVTSARGGLDAAKLRAEPEAGAMFAVDVGTKGLADAPFMEARSPTAPLPPPL